MYKLAIVSPCCLLLSIYLHGYMWCEYGMWIFVCQSVERERENSQGKLEVNQLDMFKTLFLSWAKSFLSQSLFLVKDCSLLPPFIPPMCLKNYKSVILLLPLPPPLSLTILKITVGKILRLKWMYASGNVSQLVFYTLRWCNAVICKSMF